MAIDHGAGTVERPWARSIEGAVFAHGLRSDEAAVRASLTTSWSNGPTEEQIQRLKLLKRMMYGRGKLDLLRVRAIEST